MKTVPNKIYWIGDVGPKDDFGITIVDEFIDGKTSLGPWAIMTLASWRRHGIGRLGTGYGQRYKKTDEGWLKVEG
jgi:hypothetical protein